MELVTEPEMHTAEEAQSFAEELQLILRYLGASDANMDKGQMRVELNLSLAEEGSKKLGTKVEVKNLNSFNIVGRAAAYEIKRQSELLDNGEKVIQETRGWDENGQKTFSQRLKEEAKDIHVDKEVEEYMVDLVFATRYPQNYGLKELQSYIAFGASPRASIDLFKATKALSFMRGKDHVTPLEVAYIAKEILRHRIILSYEGEAEGISTDTIVEKVLEAVPIP